MTTTDDQTALIDVDTLAGLAAITVRDPLSPT
jgi:hypothetical protein